jgi:lipoprotein signal peptidase
MNLSITHKQRWLVLTIVVIGITGAAFGIVSSGNGIWISLVAPLSLIAFALFFKNPQQHSTTTSQPTTTINKLEEMGNLIELKDQGKISDAEYQERRADLVYYK